MKRAASVVRAMEPSVIRWNLPSCRSQAPDSVCLLPVVHGPSPSLATVFSSLLLPSAVPDHRNFGTLGGDDHEKMEHGEGRRRAPRKNFRLESVKAVGISHLEQTAKDASVKASKPLFVSEEDEGPTAKQIKEANRIHKVLEEAIDSYSKREATFSIRGDPIMILDVEVSKDLRHARCYWTLPFTMLELPDNVRVEVKKRMQTILEKRGGRLQALVHSELRFYYPPRLRFVPAEDDVLSMAMKDLIQ